ncbi:MAG TPA: class I SAM-dependent methyltransferase [Gaiellaceae bacterium]|nr:class I SAM-dependent methyltransferase [Gaiellaceae bacterium]
MSWDPVRDLDAAAKLGEILRDAGYTEDAIVERLGDDGPAADVEEVPVLDRRLGHDELDNLIRLLLLHLPIRKAEIPGVKELAALNFVAEVDGAVLPQGRIVPTDGVYLAFDGFSVGLADPPGWVASYTPTSFWLASLTPRPHGRRAVDVGTGNGAHALFAARHMDHVIATDINARALDFTAIGTALNGMANVETRQGSLFDPVAGETFDLITCNAPYVVSPESRWQYRDAGERGDSFSERAVREAAAHLADGGYATLTASWLGKSEDDPDDHIHAWLDGSGCDTWVNPIRGADPLDHAAGWTDHLTADAVGPALDAWASYLAELGAGWVTEGVVVLHKRAGTRHLVFAEPVEEDDLEDGGAQAVRVLSNLALLAEGEYRRMRFRLVKNAWFREELDVEGDVTDVTLMLDEGTQPELEIEPEEIDALVDPKGFTLESVGDELLRAVLELGFAKPF